MLRRESGAHPKCIEPAVDKSTLKRDIELIRCIVMVSNYYKEFSDVQKLTPKLLLQLLSVLSSN